MSKNGSKKAAFCKIYIYFFFIITLLCDLLEVAKINLENTQFATFTM